MLRADVTEPSNWRATRHLDDWLKSFDLIGISGVDTRRLTRRIRDGGAPTGVIAHAPDGRFDLEALVASGAFRADLFYRLNGLRITLPPLRDRTDKAELIDRALELETAGLAATPRLTPEARSLLLDHDWPGNIRQLRTVVRAAVIGCEDGLIRCDDLPLAMPRFAGATSPACPAACPEAERLQAILRSHKWCVADAARSLNVSRMTLYRRMAKFGVVPPNQL